MQPKPIKIILIEDDAGHATLIKMNLKQAGLNNPVVHTTDGKAGLDSVHQILKDNPNQSLLVLLDLNLPVLDGFGVLKELKSDDLTKHIPVVMLTSTDTHHEVQRCYELGCNVYLRKPVDYEEFVNAIRKLGLFLSIVELPNS